MRNFTRVLPLLLVTASVLPLWHVSAASLADADQIAAVHAEQSFHNGDYRSAAKGFAEATRLNPGSSPHFDHLGLAYYRMAETSPAPARLVRRARHSFEQALQIDPGNTAALQHLIALASEPAGLCAGETGDTEKLLARLMQLDPEAGRRAREDWQQTLSASSRLEDRFACSPVAIGRVFRRLLAGPSGDQPISQSMLAK